MPDSRTGYSVQRRGNKNTGKVIKFPKKRNYKKMLIILLLLCLILFVMLFTPIFNINKIEVEGNERFTDEDIVNLSAIPVGQNIFKVNYIRVKNNILTNSFIEKTSISRKYPNKILISVQERKPAAAFQFIGTNLLIDNNGIVLIEENNITAMKVPSVLGVRVVDYKLGNKLNINPEDSNKFNSLLVFLKELENNELSGLINTVDLNDINKIVAWSHNNKYQINLMDSSKLDYKLRLLSKQIIPDLEKSKSPSGVIDFTIVNKPTFKPKY